MPATPEPLDESLGSMISAPAWAVAKLAQQQNKTIVNPQGQAIINEGLIPGSSPAQYGWQFMNPATAGQLMFIGEDGSGNAYVAFYDGNGTMLSKYDTTGFHFYNAGTEVTRLDAQGFHSYDASGHELTRIDSAGFHSYSAAGVEEVRAGLINASPAIYGLGVLPASGGSLQLVDGSLSATVTTLLTLSGGGLTWQDVGGPSVTATIGPSGKALCTISAACQYGTTSQLQAGVGLDGSLSPQTAPLIDQTTGSAGAVVTMSSSAVISGLSTGNHTFKMIYYGQSNSFSNNTIVVVPL